MSFRISSNSDYSQQFGRQAYWTIGRTPEISHS